MNRRSVLIGVGLVVAVALVSSGSMLVDTNFSGFIKIRQMPITGDLLVVFEPGMFGQWFGRVTEYKQAGTYTFSDEGRRLEDSASSSSVEVRFNDGGIARLSGNARFELPAEPSSMIRIHEKFRSYDHIATTLIKPAIAEALILTASLMSAEESYSGRRAEFSQLAWDQVLNGVYLTESFVRETRDPNTQELKQKRVVHIKRDADGQPIRKDNSLADFGIRISQFFLDKDLEYEDGVLQQIANQRDAFMKTVAAKAEAEKAQQDKITAEAQGQANVMRSRYKAEVVKAEAVVAAEQRKAVAETAASQRLEVARLDRQAAEEYKLAQVERAEGDATYKRKVMQADGALRDKLEALVEIQKTWAGAFAKRKVPQLIMGGQASGDTDASTVNFSEVLMLMATKQLGLDLTVPRGTTPAAASR